MPHIFQINVSVELYFTMKLLESQEEPLGAFNSVGENRLFEPPALDNGEGNGTPLQYSCLENPMDGGAW